MQWITVIGIIIPAREEHPPASQKAIEWRRLTNQEANILEAVVQRIIT